MSLYTETSGSGPDLVLVHGWGLHGGIWDGLVPRLQDRFRLTRVDLPGHGRSGWDGESSLDAMVDAVVRAVPAGAAWLGWSLGGLVAMRAALRHPGAVGALAAVAASPSFVRRPGWQGALLPELLDAFARDLEGDYRRTLDRFLALQVRGSEQAMRVLRDLRNSLLAHGLPHADGLRAGLAILRDTDLRGELHAIDVPVLLIAGERDTLVPLRTVQATRALLPHAQLEVMAGAGHAPFVADPAGFVERLLNFSS